MNCRIDESSAENACAYYQCKLATASSPEARCSYFQDFGLPYCKKYFDVRFDDPTFSVRARQCLQEAVRDTMEGKACGVVEETAFRSHIDCYVNAGYCRLSAHDKLRIVREIEPKDFNLMNGLTLLKIEAKCRELGLAE